MHERLKGIFPPMATPFSRDGQIEYSAVREQVEFLISAGVHGIVCGRSGETEDISISHLAVGLGAGQLKVGSFARSERMAKWNECLRIADEIGPGGFVGRAPLSRMVRR